MSSRILSLTLAACLAAPLAAQVDLILDAGGAGPGAPLDDPRGIAVDSQGNVYVSGFNTHNVFRISPGGQIDEVLDSTGDGVASLGQPMALAVDSADNLYVAARLSHRVFKRTPSGVVTSIIDNTGDGTNNLLFPFDLVVDESDTVYVSGSSSNNVFSIDTAGNIDQVIDVSGDGSNPLLNATGLAYYPPSGELAVTGWGSHNVFRINSGGTITEVIDSSGGGIASFGQPRTLAYDSHGRIFVAGGITNTVFRIDPDDSLALVLDASGDGQGALLDHPIGVTVSPSDTVYVSGVLSQNIFALDPAGRIEQVLDSTGDGMGNSFTGAWHMIAPEPDRLFTTSSVSDSVFEVAVDPLYPAGTKYCSPAVPNSSGMSGNIGAWGDGGVGSNDVGLHVTGAPPGQFAMFVNSQSQGFVMPPGSQGNLCLSGAIGRHRHDLRIADAYGTFYLRLDLTQVPTPNGSVAVVAGETWNWQAWFRDVGGTSNFTDGVSIQFQ